ncbi:MAG: hypothetical protein H6Q19_472 [Bacteroidetes bacterium]|nr:hypothetical protein [Bacteroidota bacterium]
MRINFPALFYEMLNFLLLKCPVHFPFIILFFKRLTFVVGFLPTRQTNFHFCPSVFVDKKFDGNNSVAGFSGCPYQFIEFLPVEQKFPVAAGFVVVVRSEKIGGDIHILHPKFVADKGTVRIGQTGFAIADGFYFRSEKLNARHIPVEYLVIEQRPFILDNYI